VDHAYKHIRERFSYEKYYYDQQNGPGGPVIVRAGTKKDDTVLGVALVDYVKLFKGPSHQGRENTLGHSQEPAWLWNLNDISELRS